MSEKPRRVRAECQYDQIVADFRPLARRTLIAIAVSRFVLALIPLQLKYLLDPVLDFRPVAILGVTVQPTVILCLLVASGLMIAIIRGVADYVCVSTAGRHGHSLVAKLRVAMYEHILRIPSSFARRRGTGKILLRFIGDSDSLRSWYSRRRPAVIVDRWLLGLLIVVMFVVDWRLALVVLIPLPLIVFASRRIAPKLADETLHARFQQAKLSGEIGYRFDSIHQAKWLDRFHGTRQPIRERAESVAALNAHRDLHAAVLQGLGQFLAFSSVPLLLLACVLLAWQDLITLGQSFAFLWLTAHMAVAIHRLNAAVVSREKAMVSKQRILKLLERTAENGRSSRNVPLVPGQHSLVLERVEFDSTHEIPEPVSLQFAGAGLYRVNDRLVPAIIGAVASFEKINAGRILINNQDLADLKNDSVRRQIGWIMDHPMIVPGTIRENLMLADPSLEPQQLEAFCFSINPDCDVNWLAKESRVHGQNLTNREVFTIAIIRALINQPDLVFVDLKRFDRRFVGDLQQCLERIRSQSIVLIADSVFDALTGSPAEVLNEPLQPSFN